MRKKRKDYEAWLNELGESLPDGEFVIGGRMRNRGTGYGTLTRKYNIGAFEAGFKEWEPSR